MATYNGEQYIKDQIDSILPQLGASDELIVSDDSSTDRTIEIVESYGDTRIRILKGRKFASPILNFENALKQANGDYIFLADQDDVWLPGRVSEILDKFKDHDLIVCDCKIVDQNLQVLKPSYFSIINARAGFSRNLLNTSPFIGCCMAFNRKVLSLALPFPARIPMHDFWIAMLAEARFKVLLLGKPLVLYRRHGANASFTGSASKYSLLRKIQFRVALLSSLIPRLLFHRV